MLMLLYFLLRLIDFGWLRSLLGAACSGVTRFVRCFLDLRPFQQERKGPFMSLTSARINYWVKSS